jgi:hypothetical protein
MRRIAKQELSKDLRWLLFRIAFVFFVLMTIHYAGRVHDAERAASHAVTNEMDSQVEIARLKNTIEVMRIDGQLKKAELMTRISKLEATNATNDKIIEIFKTHVFTGPYVPNVQ